MALLELTNISKTFYLTGAEPSSALNNVSLSLDEGCILCLLGPSGCGKTTLLRVIAGLEQPDQGIIRFAGEDIAGLAPHRRCFGMMFQDYALFPHKTVKENIAFGLEMQGFSRREIKQRIAYMIELVGLQGFENRDIFSLSGGERQRTALARSLAPGPRMLLLDEPLASLDRELRERLLHDLRQILRQLQVTAVFVTHDQSEAFIIADHIMLLKQGTEEQTDTPYDLYMNPRTEFVARFLGFNNLISGQTNEEGGVLTAIGCFFPLPRPKPGNQVTLLFRPDSVRAISLRYCPEPAPATECRLSVITKACLFTGKYFRLMVKLEAGYEFSFDIDHRQTPPRPGDAISLLVDQPQIIKM